MNKRGWFSVPFSLGLVVLMVVCSFIPLVFALSEVLVNGGFETGDFIGWSVQWGDGEVTNDQHYEGLYSFTGDSVAYIGNTYIIQGFDDLNSSKVNSYSCYVKGGVGQSANQSALFVTYQDTTTDFFDLTANGAGYADWTLVNATLRANELISSVGVDLYGDTDVGESDIFVDKVSLMYVPEEDETPPVPDTSSSGNLGDGFAYLLPALIVILIPTVVLTVVVKMGVWGGIVGLAIGTGLAYFFLPSPYQIPVWMVFLVGLGEFGLVMGSRRG